MAMMDDPIDLGPGDWWTQNAPPATPTLTGPVTDPHDPRLADPAYASDPEVLKFLNAIYGPDGTAMNRPTPTSTWNADAQAWNPDATATPTPSGGGGGGGTSTGNTGAVPVGVPTSGFGAAPAPYASDPNAPQYTPLPEYRAPQWTGGDYVAPTQAELESSPGYQSRLSDLMKRSGRQFSAQGTLLNGGTLQALDRRGQEYASNEYQNLRANTLEAYKQRYGQFQDAAGRDLASRTVNANENQNTFQNRTNTYLSGNNRTLSDYLTNYTGQRNAELDYWNRLQDVNQTGAQLAGGSR